MALIVLENMAGVAPKLTPEALPENAAQVASNGVLIHGGVAPLKAPVTVATPSKPGIGQTLYRFGRTPPVGQEEALYWFKWDKPVQVTKGPIAGDTTERTYFTGDGIPKKTDMTLALTGGTDYPMAAYQLGVPAPVSAPILTLVAGAGPTVAETRAYVYTNVTAWGEESAPSPPAMVTVEATQAVQLSAWASWTIAGYLVARRIYRTVKTSAGTDYYFVGEIANDLPWTDTTAVTAIGEPLPSLYWAPPPDDLEGLIALPSGALCGISKSLKAVCFSVPNAPYAWPEKYRQTTDFVPVGVAAMGQAVVVLTEGFPYLINAGDVEQATMARLDEEYPCIAPRSIVPFGGGVVYASPDGLASVTTGGVKLLTAGYYDRAAWMAINPASLFAVKHDNRYYGFLPGAGGLILDAEKGITWHDVAATAAYVDPVLDQLYVLVGGAVQRWHSGAAKTATWRSKRFRQSARVPFSCAQVIANSYAGLTFRLYVDGALAHDAAVVSADPFRVPSFRRAATVEIEIAGSDHWLRAALASSIEELKRV